MSWGDIGTVDGVHSVRRMGDSTNAFLRVARRRRGSSTAFVGLTIILLNAFFPDASIQVQPSTPSGSVSEFVRATNQEYTAGAARVR